MDWGPLYLTLKLALATTFILVLVGIPLGYWLSRTTSWVKPVIETLVSMPLVLPPTVLGFYFLIVFGPEQFLGSWIDKWLGIRLVFSFPGLVLASVIYSLPFMVQPIHSGLSSLPNSLLEASLLMGKSKWQTLIKVGLPNIKPALLTGIILSFAHTIGEFGVVLMIGGSIPDKTRVASIAIYEEVEALNYTTAHTYSLFLLVLAFIVLMSVYLINGGYLKRFWR
ncbi:molybdate ABC transporter permease subunit [Poritiphilus sp. M415]|uniref:Molybdenum transport system permease n=2 Tax=Lentiprolixibacter aurantiacus TaxID=2993939 RepID=A0AAE3MLL8_9FLAO|nr:molybdate ABC transporter permease subunit [Lentiprolixibacter aurantiacus]MCX2720026.1 molybdate ABC transporter permease subunit [Lentiprolixibacter aurantiacus]